MKFSEILKINSLTPLLPWKATWISGFTDFSTLHWMGQVFGE